MQISCCFNAVAVIAEFAVGPAVASNQAPFKNWMGPGSRLAPRVLLHYFQRCPLDVWLQCVIAQCPQWELLLLWEEELL